MSQQSTFYPPVDTCLNQPPTFPNPLERQTRPGTTEKQIDLTDKPRIRSHFML